MVRAVKSITIELSFEIGEPDFSILALATAQSCAITVIAIMVRAVSKRGHTVRLVRLGSSYSDEGCV